MGKEICVSQFYPEARAQKLKSEDQIFLEDQTPL